MAPSDRRAAKAGPAVAGPAPPASSAASRLPSRATDRAAAERSAVHEAAPALPKSARALLLIDVINPLQFDGAEDIAQPALEAATAIATLKRRLGAEGVPAFYVNDNFGWWQSDFEGLLERCRRQGGPAAALARRLAPAVGDITVLKPHYSGFYATPLQLLLTRMGVRELVITGLAADLCVMFTAMDAYERGYGIRVPADCTAAETAARKQAALDWMALALKAQVGPSSALPELKGPVPPSEGEADGMPFAERSRQKP